jgi:hypothetical protein
MVKALALRRILVVCLALALALGGFARAAAAGETARPASIVIAGVTVSFCVLAAGAEPPGVPSDATHHDCDHCTLASPATQAAPEMIALPLRFARPAEHGPLSGDTPRSRARSAAAFPRGPPVA